MADASIRWTPETADRFAMAAEWERYLGVLLPRRYKRTGGVQCGDLIGRVLPCSTAQRRQIRRRTAPDTGAVLAAETAGPVTGVDRGTVPQIHKAGRRLSLFEGKR